MNNYDHIHLLENIAGILIRCFLLTYGLLLIWFVFCLAGGDWGYNLTSQRLNVSKHEYDLVCYCGIVFTKIIALTFFLIPYIAIKLILKKEHSA